MVSLNRVQAGFVPPVAPKKAEVTESDVVSTPPSGSTAPSGGGSQLPSSEHAKANLSLQQQQELGKGKGKAHGKHKGEDGFIPPGIAKKSSADLPDGNPWKAVLKAREDAEAARLAEEQKAAEEQAATESAAQEQTEAQAQSTEQASIAAEENAAAEKAAAQEQAQADANVVAINQIQQDQVADQVEQQAA